VLGNNWNWGQWQDIGDDDSIAGPLETDHYNGPHGIKMMWPHLSKPFSNVFLQLQLWIEISSNDLLHNQTNMQERKCVLSHNLSIGYTGARGCIKTCSRLVK